MQTSRTFSVFFWLKMAKKKGENAPVYARITVDGKRVEMSLKRSTEVTYWDNNLRRSLAKNPKAKALNLFLDQVNSELCQCYQELCREVKLVTAQAVKARYMGEDEEHKTLLDLLEYHKTKMTSTLRRGTLKNYDTTEKYLKRFLNSKLKTNDIYLSQISYSFIVDFELFLRKGPFINRAQPLNNNGVMKHLERLKKLLNLALKLEWVEKDPFCRFSLKFQKYERNFLTKNELEALEEAELKQQKYIISRDVFIFSCYTGLSYSDVKGLTEKDIIKGIDGEYWIFSQRKKNDQFIKIPLLKKALGIIEAYSRFKKEEKLLPIFSNQKINQYLQEITASLGITKKITFHSARHTFATTITLSNGVPIETVSKLLGHSKLSTTQIYARVVEQKVSSDMSILRKKIEPVSDLNVEHSEVG